jgi:hypothetical protein
VSSCSSHLKVENKNKNNCIVALILFWSHSSTTETQSHENNYQVFWEWKKEMKLALSCNSDTGGIHLVSSDQTLGSGYRMRQPLVICENHYYLETRRDIYRYWAISIDNNSWKTPQQKEIIVTRINDHVQHGFIWGLHLE